MTMTPEWQNAATQFGLSPEDAEAHWKAWQDLERLRPEAFVNDTLRAFAAAAEAKRADSRRTRRPLAACRHATTSSSR